MALLSALKLILDIMMTIEAIKTLEKDTLFDLDHKVVLVTGASSGIGLHLCSMLLARGCRVVGASRTACESDVLGVLNKHYSGNFLAVNMDVRSAPSVDAAFDTIADAFGHLDVVINNAGMAAPKRAVDMTSDEWAVVIDTNLTGPFLVSRAAVRLMPNGGSIIQVASIGAFKAYVGLSAYNSSKAGVLMLAQTLALELAPQHIRVNVLAPGYVVTPMNDEFLSGPQGEPIRKNIPLRRFAQTKDLDGAIVFLASSASSYVTGTRLVVDGGCLA